MFGCLPMYWKKSEIVCVMEIWCSPNTHSRKWMTMIFCYGRSNTVFWSAKSSNVNGTKNGDSGNMSATPVVGKKSDDDNFLRFLQPLDANWFCAEFASAGFPKLGALGVSSFLKLRDHGFVGCEINLLSICTARENARQKDKCERNIDKRFHR